MRTRLAIIGAGPVGLEMALAASYLGFDACVYEAGRVGEHLSWFRDVTLFTPFSMNSTEATRGRLRRFGARKA
jgi:thioredoxin reductase